MRKFGWKVPHRAGAYTFTVDFELRELTVGNSNDEPVKKVALAEELFANSEVEIELSTIDEMVVVLIGGVEVTQFELTTPESARDSAVGSFQLGAAVTSGAGQKSPLGRVRIWRDIYYLAGEHGSSESQMLAGSADGYLLLGDNQPLSIDSRHWPEVSVPSDQLIGKVQK